MIRYHARWVVPVAAPPLPHATVAVEGDTIAWVGPRDRAPAGRDLELGDVALIPGLVCAHSHLERTLLRGAGGPPTRLDALADTIAMLARDATLDAARLGLVEGVGAGVTTFADVGSGASLAAMVEAGVRGIAYRELTGALPIDREPAMAALRAAVGHLRPMETALARLGVAPRSADSVHEDLLVDVCAYALGERLPIAMHASVSDDEIALLRDAAGPYADALRARGADVVRRAHSMVHLLAELGVAAAAQPLLAHATRFDASDVALVAHYDCPVVHCPTSDARRGRGVAPLGELLESGARVGLGAGAPDACGRIDMLGEARLAALLSGTRAGRPRAPLGAALALELATLGGARALGLDAVIGSLEPGKQADLAAFPLDTPPAVPAIDPVDALVFGIGGGARASFVAVAGRVLVREGRVLGADPGLPVRVQQAAETLAALRAHAG